MSFFFFFNDTATTEIYTLSLHDALPILEPLQIQLRHREFLPSSCRSLGRQLTQDASSRRVRDRKSTRLNSSHVEISYAVFCLKKKKKKKSRENLRERQMMRK